MNLKIKPIIGNYNFIVLIFALFAFAASFQSLVSNKKAYYEGGIEYNKYNNYTIFEKSFHHVKEGKDLYILYPEEHWDLYKYTPTFAVFFGIFAIFPDWIGLNLWNFLNAFMLLFAIYYLPKLNNYQKGLILIISLIELMTSMQNNQSNALIAGLIILSFGLLEREKYLFAAFCIIFSVYIKLFGVVGFALFLFYPKKWKLAAYSALWAIILFIIPLIYITVEQYQFLFSSYWNSLSNDSSASLGYSVMGWLNSWFGLDINKMFIVLSGLIIFLIPLFRIGEYKNYAFKIFTLASILIWVVIFNHKAESPTFIIAISGVALWFTTTEKSKINIILFVISFIFVSLSPTDIFPAYIRNEWVKPYTLKAVPCILIWFKIVFDMLKLHEDKISNDYVSEQNEIDLAGD